MSLLEYILGTLFGLALSFAIQYAYKRITDIRRRNSFNKILEKLQDWQGEEDTYEEK